MAHMARLCVDILTSSQHLCHDVGVLEPRSLAGWGVGFLNNNP